MRSTLLQAEGKLKRSEQWYRCSLPLRIFAPSSATFAVTAFFTAKTANERKESRFKFEKLSVISWMV